LGKWLARNPKLLILDEPTKGIDVGAKAEIYRIIESLVEEKIAILMISSELPEIIGISDRVLVFHKGEVVAHYRHDEISEEKLLLSASGVNSIGEKEEIELETKG
jgi:ABC-type sugar transport system ATPase subunit